MHDAALAYYERDEALEVGRVLERCGYLWFEEPLPDQDLVVLRDLRAALDILVVSGETLMHDHDLCWGLRALGCTDLLRANGRHRTTPLLEWVRRGARVEPNGPGGLFGLVHVHLCCGLPEPTMYEYFPGGARDERGEEIGLADPPLPVGGMIATPEGPGWGAEWDWAYFEKERAAML